jgi:SAM-dependent methyltransferase
LRRFKVGIEGARILELGFGTGFYLDIWHAMKASHVTGFDITDIAVKAAQERYPRDWNFARADIGKPLPLKERAGTFDLATAFDVLFHLVEDAGWNGALDNIASALRPGGHAVIFDKCQSTESAVGHVRRRTLDSYTKALAARGFEVLAVKPLFVLMNSPTDLSGIGKLAFKTSWSLTKMPFKIGRRVGLGEILGATMGAGMYWPELLLTHALPRGPSTKILLARKT